MSASLPIIAPAERASAGSKLAASASVLGSAVVLLVATLVSVADNGLAFTTVAEMAGPAWSGRAMGIQNSGQFLVASLVGPAVGALIAAVGYPLAFAAVALCPAISIPLVPPAAQELDRHG